MSIKGIDQFVNTQSTDASMRVLQELQGGGAGWLRSSRPREKMLRSFACPMLAAVSFVCLLQRI